MADDGERVRREVLGDEHVDAAVERTSAGLSETRLSARARSASAYRRG